MDKDKLWQAALAQLQLVISRPLFSIWFSKTFIKSITKKRTGQLVEIAVQNFFVREKLEKNYTNGSLKITFQKIINYYVETAIL